MKHRLCLTLFASLVAVAAASLPGQIHAMNGNARLENLDEQEERQLLARLSSAQDDIRKKKEVYFTLTSGSPALFDKVDVTPRAAFATLDLSRPWSVEKLVKPANVNTAQYRLEYFPQGLGHLYWEVTVVLDFNGDVAAVNMLYEAPAPF